MGGDYEYWRDLNVIGMQRFFSIIGRGAPDGQTIERPGLIASVCPGVPHFSLFNSVIYDDAAGLANALGELADIYEQAGVRAWTVWVPDRDFDARVLMIDAGHALDTSPRLMGRELAGLEPHSMEGIEWTAEGSPDDIVTLNERAYGVPDGGFVAGFGRLSPDDFTIYVASTAGEPASCLLTLDVEDDCGIYGVATPQEARGKGLSGALMRQALADARDRGLETTSLQSSKLGRPVYSRLGYVDYGCFEMWERRKRE